MTLSHETPADIGTALPAPLESETMFYLRGFLTPIFENAHSWSALRAELADKGYTPSFRQGRMVLCRTEDGEPVCTGQSLGVPLRNLAARLGRARVIADPGGTCGRLNA